MLSRVSVRRNTTWWLLLTFVLLHCSHVAVNAWDTKYVWVESEGKVDNIRPEFILKDHGRYRRDLAASPTDVPAPTPNVTSDNGTSTEKPTTLSSTTNATPSMVPTPSNADNKTVTETANATVNSANATVVKKPLLGENGTGIYHGKGNITPKEVSPNATAHNTTASNSYTNNTPKVSNPIVPYDDTDLSSVFSETPETIQAKENITNLKYDNHTYYNSLFMNNITYFNEHWTNITKVQLEIHPVLSNSHRHATTLKLSFDFPFYGFPLREITVATGGFIYTGEHMHNWLAATQYIAPLMANFDTKIGNFSYVKLYDDGDKFTALWERVYLKEHTNDTDNKEFTFACTLYKNGDIVFAYKDVPIPISNISDKLHPVKVGISDAYITDTILFYVRRKSIYEYHRVLFNKDHPITSGTVLKLIALPTCIQQNSCETCLNNNSSFTCFWCEQMQKCSSGTDRGKQDWQLRRCDKTQISSESQCPAQFNHTVVDNSTAYVTDTHISDDHVFKINSQVPASAEGGSGAGGGVAAGAPSAVKHAAAAARARGASSVGGAVTACVVLALVCTLGAWLLYAFKNPHTRSGQLLIKYRPSQWSWRRGEARYTAATIHM